MTASDEACGTVVAVDGSMRKIRKGRTVGMAWVDDAGDWWLDYFPFHPRFNSAAHVFHAELRAVKKAVLLHNHKVDVLCDSQGVVELVQAWQRGETGDVPKYYWTGLYQFRDVVHADPDRFTITWVRGHAGHPLNEAADALAGLGSRARRDGLTRAAVAERASGIAASFASTYREAAA